MPSKTANEMGDRTRRNHDHWLHRLYFHGAGVHFFFSRRLRRAGIALILVFVLAACLGVGHDRNSVYQLLFLSMGMILIGIPWAMSRRANLDGRREMPRFGTVGIPLIYHVRVANCGRKRLTRAWIADSPPDARPTLGDFSSLREPGEDERNGFDRRLAYFRWQWILLGNLLFSGGFARADLDLKSGENSRVAVEITPLRRGVIRFSDLRILLPDPFGLFQRCKKVVAPPATLTILPRRYSLPPLQLPGGAAFKISGEANTNSIGNSGEFVGLRDYRPGDPLRQIHWKSWAKTGRPIVKELEDTYYPRYGLIVDTLSQRATDHQFEEAVSVAASFVSSLDTNDSLLDLMFIKDQAHLVTAGRGVERAERLLEILASVAPERIDNFDALAQLVLRHREDLTSCLVILNGWDELRSKFLQSLARAGVICAPIIIGCGPAPEGVPGHWLESGQIARDLGRLPIHLNTNI